MVIYYICYYFVEYNIKQLNLDSSKMISTTYPDFDNQRLYTYAYLYDRNKNIDVKIVRYKYVNGELKHKKVIKCDTQEDLFKYFNEK